MSANSDGLSENLPFRPVSKSQDKLKKDKGKVYVFQNGIYDRSSYMSKGPMCLLIDEIHDDRCCQPVGC